MVSVSRHWTFEMKDPPGPLLPELVWMLSVAVDAGGDRWWQSVILAVTCCGSNTLFAICVVLIKKQSLQFVAAHTSFRCSCTAARH
jgi:hypothetical protein